MTTSAPTTIEQVTQKYTSRLCECSEGAGSIRMHGGCGGEQATGIGVLGRVEELGGRGLFHDAAVLHDGDVIRDLTDDGQIVRDEEHGEGVSEAKFAQQREDLRLDGDVERGGGFVCDEELRAVDEGHRDEDALALASRELVRVVADAAFGVW